MPFEVNVHGEYRQTIPGAKEKSVAPYKISVIVPEVDIGHVRRAVMAKLPSTVPGYASLRTAFIDSHKAVDDAGMPIKVHVHPAPPPAPETPMLAAGVPAPATLPPDDVTDAPVVGGDYAGADVLGRRSQSPKAAPADTNGPPDFNPNNS